MDAGDGVAGADEEYVVIAARAEWLTSHSMKLKRTYSKIKTIYRIQLPIGPSTSMITRKAFNTELGQPYDWNWHDLGRYSNLECHVNTE